MVLQFEVICQNLNGINLGGVTLTAPNGSVEVFDDRFGVGYHSPTKAIANLLTNVQDNPLIGVFDSPTSFVSLWGGDEGGPGGDIDSWTLNVYDAVVGGNLVGTASSGSWVGSPYIELIVSAASILRFEAFHTGTEFGMGFDDLEFSSVPEPATILLIGTGLIGLGVFGRKKFKK